MTSKSEEFDNFLKQKPEIFNLEIMYGYIVKEILHNERVVLLSNQLAYLDRKFKAAYGYKNGYKLMQKLLKAGWFEIEDYIN